MTDMQNEEQSAVMNLDEVCSYLRIGKTNARAFLKKHEHDFVIHIGRGENPLNVLFLVCLRDFFCFMNPEN